jgi:hypothetical protein
MKKVISVSKSEKLSGGRKVDQRTCRMEAPDLGVMVFHWIFAHISPARSDAAKGDLLVKSPEIANGLWLDHLNISRAYSD